MRRPITFTAIAVLMVMPLVAGQGSQAANESLWEASRAGDTTRITAALAAGADVNAKSRYDVTPLIFAAGSGRLDAVKLLLSRGANVNAQDTFYHAGAVDMALTNGHADVAIVLIQSGRPREAIEHFQAAVRLRPDDADLRHNLDRAMAVRAASP